jgi:hypothetical protein
LSRQAPQWFVRAITSMDPMLSVRESVSSSAHWVIERKGIVTPEEIATTRRRRDRLWRWIQFPNETQKKNMHQNRVGWQSIADEVEALEHGKRVICRPRVLNQQVYNDLCQSDIRRYGGAARYCTEIEQAEERHDAEMERILSNKRTAMNAEIFDIMSFLDRKRTDAMCNKPESELDLQYLLHGRHSKPGDAPVIQLSDF